MRLLESIAEYEMVAAYLAAESESSSFAEGLEHFRRGLGVDRRVITEPNTKDPVENEQRARVLGYRGYGNKGIFQGFPVGTVWTRAEMDLEELRQVRYIRDDGWTARSGGTRLASEAARRISGLELLLPEGDKIRAIEADLQGGKRFPPLILAGENINRPTNGLVVLEGHARLTAYLLRPELVAMPLEVIVGYSAEIARWVWY